MLDPGSSYDVEAAFLDSFLEALEGFGVVLPLEQFSRISLPVQARRIAGQTKQRSDAR